MRRRSGLGVIVAVLLGAASPPPSADRPAMWVVKDADTTIYLLGGVTILPPRPAWFDGPIRQAFDRSDALVLEVPQDPTAASRAAQARGIAVTGPPLERRLPGDGSCDLAPVLAERKLPPTALSRMEPWLAAMVVSAPSYPAGFSPDHGTDRTLAAAAATRNIPVSGIETAADQVDRLASLPVASQVGFLCRTLARRGEAPAQLGRIAAAWRRGDLEALSHEVRGEIEHDPALLRALLTAPNERYAAWIAARLARPGTVFVSVTAGHLAGADSVQALLAARGIAATRVGSRPGR